MTFRYNRHFDEWFKRKADRLGIQDVEYVCYGIKDIIQAEFSQANKKTNIEEVKDGVHEYHHMVMESGRYIPAPLKLIPRPGRKAALCRRIHSLLGKKPFVPKWKHKLFIRGYTYKVPTVRSVNQTFPLKAIAGEYHHRNYWTLWEIRIRVGYIPDIDTLVISRPITGPAR
jgi:hypothetical protein